MRAREYLDRSRRLEVGILAASPLLAIYEAGLLLSESPVRNGADAVLRRAFLAGFGQAGRFLFGLLLVCALLAAALHAARRKVPAHRYAFPVAVEGLLYAALLGPAVLLLRSRLGDAAIALETGEGSPVLASLLAVGAGVYEEIAFRLLLLPALYVLALRMAEPLGAGKGTALGIALAVSSLAFAGFHHLGAFGTPFDAGAFAFRTIAGAILGGLFVGRGIGVAIYTHAFYDLLYLAG
ncbi:MAG: CPBP family glutamic-type intramembrane protease [Planctomycetes bacterium]|nr:CPBP family glutamic-type intramembrane protease [Planctomycetota bacterium]